MQSWHSNWGDHWKSQFVVKFELVRQYLGLPFESILQHTFAYSKGPAPSSEIDKKITKEEENKRDNIEEDIFLIIPS